MSLTIMKHAMQQYLRVICLIWFILCIPKLILAQTFIHPGILHKESDFDRMRQKVQAGLQPWQAGWDKLVANSHAQLDYIPSPVTTIIRGNGWPENYWTFMNDVAAAYQCALRWKISGNNAYGDKAVQIMNTWASTCTGVDGSPDVALVVGLQGFQLANAAEIMRSYSGWSASDFAKFKDFMIRVFYVNASKFLFARNGTCPTTYFASWGLCNASAVAAVGILCDDMHIYNEGMYYFKYGPYTEAINNAVYYLHSPILGQWQESNRDQSHTLLGIGLAADLCEMAWNQGDDLYSFANRRLLAGFEYVAKYNLGNDVPDVPYNNCENVNQTAIGTDGRGGMRPIWERIYNHYVNRVGLQVPYSQQFASLSRPEGGGGDFGTSSGGFDNIGFGTLTNSLDPLPPGCVPSSLTPFAQINGGAQTQTSNLTVPAGATVKLSPQASDNGTWSWSNGQSTQEIILTNLQKSGIYRATFTNSCGLQSVQSFCIGVSGDCLPTPIIPYTRVNTDNWQQTDHLLVDSGANIIFGPQPVNQGNWRWSTGDTVRQITINNWKASANVIAYYTNPCGVSVVDTFRVTVRNPKLDLKTVLNAAIKLRDTTQTSTTVIPGMYPVAAKAMLNDSIVYVQSHYDSVRSTTPDINSYIGLLNRSIQRYRQSVYYESNKLQDGTYYIMNLTKDSLLTVSNNNATQFNTKATDKKSQLFNLSKDGNGNYKITLIAPPPPGYQNYINENGQIGINNYDPTWNAFNIFFDGQHYAIERTQNAGNGFWSINGKFIGFQSGNANSPLPQAFPFTLQPDLYYSLDIALAQAIKLRDTTQTTAGTELGKFPQTANSQLADSIAYVQGQYQTISTVSQSSALVTRLNNAMLRYRNSMFYSTNNLDNGTYYIMNIGKDSLLTVSNTNTPQFSSKAKDPKPQLFNITKDSNGRYKITLVAPPPSGYQNYINENGQIGSNNYDSSWNTFNIFFDGKHYAIERTQNSGNGFWSINGNIIGHQSGDSNNPIPQEYPFTLQPDLYTALDQTLAQAIKLRDTTQTTTGTDLGKFPQSANNQLADSIAYVQGQYSTLTTLSQSTALINRLNNAMSVYRKSMFYSTNQLMDGIYFIKDGDTESYWTTTSGNAPDFEQRNNDINTQRWRITKQPNGRYAINSLKSPPTGYQNYINENAQFGSNNYDATWNTMMFYFDGTHYAIERAEQAGNGYWYSSNNSINTTGNLSDTFPYTYPFKLVLAPDTQRISFTPIGNLHVNDRPVVLTAQATSGLPVTFASSDTTIVRILADSIHILKAGTCSIIANQPGNGFFAAAPAVSQNITVFKLNQTFTQITSTYNNIIGDADFTLSATASSQLPVTYRSLDSTIVSVSGNVAHIISAGTARIVATQAGNDTFNEVDSTVKIIVRPLNLVLQYKDDDNNLSNNSIKPDFKIVNQDSSAVALNELTVRYWFTPENYTGIINNTIDYAQIGAQNITGSYVSLQSPRKNAFGYEEYHFSAATGNLQPGADTGPIEARLANSDWSNFDESNDYSFNSSTGFILNPKMTIYRNGTLVWGIEPLADTVALKINVWYKNMNHTANTNTIHPAIMISNDGNIPVNYADLEVRYWFTKDGTENLNYYLDYSKLPPSQISAHFYNFIPAIQNADTYLSLTFNSGVLYPLSASGDIESRIAKLNWSNFNEENDYSYKPAGDYAINSKIGVYYKGKLISGVEPQLTANQLMSDSNSTMIRPPQDVLYNNHQYLLYPNPVIGNTFFIRTPPELLNQDIAIKVLDVFGKIVLQQAMGKNVTGVLTVSANNWRIGVYSVIINDKKALKFVLNGN